MLRLASRHVASHRRKGRSTWGGSGPGLCYAAAWPPPPRSSSVLSSPATGRGGRKEEGAYLDRAGKDADHAGPELRPSTTTTRKQRRAPLPRQENDDLKLNRKRLPSASPTTCLMKFLNSGSNSLGFPGAEETSQKIKYNYGNYDDYLHTGSSLRWWTVWELLAHTSGKN